MGKVIAVDFDGTLCENAWPEIGKPKIGVITRLFLEQQYSAKLILWTCRTNEKLKEAVKWCEKYNLHFDAVNENLPEIIDSFGGDNRKIYADEYWDDKAVRIE